MRSVLMRHALPDQPQHVLDSLLVSVVVPEESTNLITNPSAETAITGWTATGTGVSVARDTSDAFLGGASIKMIDTSVTPGNEYISSNSFTVVAGQTYTLSFRYKKTARGAGTAWFVWTGIGSTPGAMKVGTIADWEYMILTAVAPAGATSATVIFSTDGATAGTVFTLWIDAVQVEAKPYATTYIDGDQDGCEWLGTPHASQSFRSAQTRKGGRLMKLSDFGFRLAAVIGLGAAPLTTIATPYALIGGGYYQRSVSPARAFSLVGGFEGRGDTDMKRNRADLLRAVHPMLTGQPQPVRLYVEPASCGVACGDAVVIDAVYGGGLEGNQTNDVGIERASLSFTTFLPFAAVGTTLQDNSTTLAFSSTLSNANNFVMQRNVRTGQWANIGALSAGHSVFDAKVGKDGALYIVGNFTSVGGVSANRIAKWDGLAWTALGTGLNGQALALDFGPDGALYVVGDFSTAGGGAASRVAKWNGSAWSALGNGLTGTNGPGAGPRGASIKFAANGVLYVGGSFSTAGFISAANIAAWDGLAWFALGAGITGGGVEQVIALDADEYGNLYAGGSFTTAGAVAANCIAVYKNYAWQAMADGVLNNASPGSEAVDAIFVDTNGSVYLSGYFDEASGQTIQNVARWNGSAFESLGAGFTAASTAVAFRILRTAPDALIFAGGVEVADNPNIAGVARWNGSAWVPAAIDLATSEYIFGLAFPLSGVAAAGTFNDANVPGYTQVQVDDAAFSYPRIVFSGPGTLISLRNWTAGAEIRFNVTLYDGESATLTLGPTPTLVSTWRGRLPATSMQGAGGTWRLLNGTNNVSLYITGTSGNTSARMYWKNYVQSLDEVY